MQFQIIINDNDIYTFIKTHKYVLDGWKNEDGQVFTVNLKGNVLDKDRMEQIGLKNAIDVVRDLTRSLSESNMLPQNKEIGYILTPSGTKVPILH